jgi:hypothetical protein
MLAYLGSGQDEVPLDERVKMHFGVSIGQLDRIVRRYSSNAYFNAARYEFVRPQPVAAGPGRELSEADSLKMLARVMLDTGLHPERVGEVIAAAEKRAPESRRCTC